MSSLVLVSDRYTTESIAKLRQHCEVNVLSQDEFYNPCTETQNAQALLIRSQTKVDQKILKLYPHLKLVVTATSGLDHIDFAACETRHVQIKNTPDANAQSAAEHTILLMLGCLKHIQTATSSIQNGRWREGLKLGGLLQKKQVGILGLGRVGSRVAKLAQAFGAEVYAYDPYIDIETFEEHGVTPLGITELLKTANVISLHVPLNPETRHFFRKSLFEEMSSESILINAARGEVVNEKDLFDALQMGLISGAGLDVFEREPLDKKAQILSAPNIFCTPHQGAMTEEAFQQASMEAVEICLNYLDNPHT